MAKKKYISQEHSASGQGRNIQEGTPKSRAATIFAASFFSFAVFMAIGLVTFTIVFFFSKVDGSSMMTTLNANYTTDGNTDSVIVNRHLKPKKGDIVVLAPPYTNEDEHYIKRVIATGGDRIYFHINNDNTFTILVNDVELNEWYLDDYWGQNVINDDYEIVFKAIGNGYSDGQKISARNTMASNSVFYSRFSNWVPEFEYENTQYNRTEILVPPGYFFYVGDNRGGNGSGPSYNLMSKDESMYRGPQSTSIIVGTVVDMMNHRSAPKWVWEKIVWFVTFKWAR